MAPGDRVALLVPPGADLTAAAHACWRAGASVVVADPGLGCRRARAGPARRAPRARRRRPARPHAGGRARGCPGSRIAAGPVPPGLRRVLGSPVGLAALARRGRALLDGGAALPAEAAPDDEAAVLFTSGATGPAKGVVYRHQQARAQLAALRAAYGITAGRPARRRLPPVRALRPGARDPVGRARRRAKPGAAHRRGAGATRSPPSTRRWSSPPPPRCATSSRPRAGLDAGSARRPGRRPPGRLRRRTGARGAAARAARRAAERRGAHAVRDDRGAAGHRRRARRDRRRRARQRGVRRPSAARRRRRGEPADATARRTGRSPASPASPARSASPPPHVKDRYDQLWAVQRRSAREPGRHRTGDVGHLDAEGRLWVEGRLVHVVDTADGPGDPGRDRAAGRGGRRGRVGGGRSGSGRRGRSRWWWSWSPSRGSRPGAPGHRCWPSLALTARSARSRGCPVAAVLRGRRPARRHPARGEDRPHAGGGVGRTGAGGRAGGAAAVRVLVTGARGMLGGAVALALAARGDDVTVLQRRPSGLPVREVLADLGDPDAPLDAALAGQDAVVHLAAKVDVVGPWREYARTNVDGTRRLLAAARAAGVARFVHVSSPSVAHAGDALVGAGAGPADPGGARGHYARSKALAEQAVLTSDDAPPRSARHAGAARTRRQERATRRPETRNSPAVVVVRPHLVWGPGDTQLVGRIVARARAGRLAVVGTGAALIDTTYVDDAVDALVAALDRAPDLHGRVLVVSGGEPRPGRRAAGVDLRRRRRAGPPSRRAGPARPRRGCRRRDALAARAADDPVPRRAAVDRALVRPARDPRGAGLGTAGRARRGLPAPAHRRSVPPCSMASPDPRRPDRHETRDGVELTSLDGPLFDGAEHTKRDLVDYLDAVRHAILPALAGRALSVMRVRPGQQPFMQKNLPKYAPDWIARTTVWAEASHREVTYPLCDDRRTLLLAGEPARRRVPPRADPGRGAARHAPGAGPRPAGGRRLRPRRPRGDAGPARAGRPGPRRRRQDQRQQGRPRRSCRSPRSRSWTPPPRPAPWPPARRRSTRRSRPRRSSAPTAPARSSSTPPARSARRSSPPTARGSGPGLPVSFPVAWDDLPHVTPADFTVATAPDLLASGDPWAAALPEPQELPGRADRARPHDPRGPGGGDARGQAPQARPAASSPHGAPRCTLAHGAVGAWPTSAGRARHRARMPTCGSVGSWVCCWCWSARCGRCRGSASSAAAS